MKTFKKIIIPAIVCVLFASCSITRPYAVTNNAVGSKTGKSETTCVFSPAEKVDWTISSAGLCFNSNYGIAEAAKAGGIEKVATVDLKITNYVFFAKYELIVTGE